MIKQAKYALIFVFFVANYTVFAQCTSGDANEFKNLGTTVNLSDYISCPNGDVVLNNVGSNGSGKIIFDQNFTFNSLTVNFQNGNKPAEFVIPNGITVTITTDLTFNGMPDKDKFLTVDGNLIVGGTLDFGGLTLEIDGTGSISADDITGADNVGCADSGTCPTTTSNTCDSGSGDYCTTALPINLAYFNVTPLENEININWVTYSEENNDYFTLERSQDGIKYSSIATIRGAGTTTEMKSYQYNDEHPLMGNSYYRLKQTDYDGNYEIFDSKQVYLSNLSEVYLVPNPVEHGTKLKLLTGASPEEEVTLNIYNSAGIVVFTQTILSGNEEIQLADSLLPGLYVAKIRSGDKQFVKRLLIK